MSNNHTKIGIIAVVVMLSLIVYFAINEFQEHSTERRTRNKTELDKYRSSNQYKLCERFDVIYPRNREEPWWWYEIKANKYKVENEACLMLTVIGSENIEVMTPSKSIHLLRPGQVKLLTDYIDTRSYSFPTIWMRIPFNQHPQNRGIVEIFSRCK